MNNELAGNERSAFEVANMLDDAADAIRDRSKEAYAAGLMSLDAYMEARAQELELRSELQVIVATDLSEALATTEEAEKGIAQSITDARVKIETIKSVKDGLAIVAALVTLAGAMASGDLKGIAKAGKAVARLT